MRFNKFNLSLILLLLILLSVGAASAADDLNATESNDDLNLDTADYPETLTSSNEEEVVTASSHTITQDNYNQYFSSEGVSSKINSGDTIAFEGSFSGVNFILDKQVNVEASPSSSFNNCFFNITSGASGTTISNLKISNTINQRYGIFIDGASNCLIQNCVVTSTGA